MRGPSRLRKFLRDTQQKQRAVADGIGVSAPIVSMWLAGRRTPGLDSAVKLETYTGGFVRATDWLTPHRARVAARSSLNDKHPPQST
jgi:transcriptional regulator with XRE-family HTH domain